MNRYQLDFIIPSPGDSNTFLEFSPNGQFLAAGDRYLSSLFILDRFAGFHPKISDVTPRGPTALVWETNKSFYVGLRDGCFIHYEIDSQRNILVEGVAHDHLRGEGFPVTAMALDTESKTLVLSVGPAVFAFRRSRATGEFTLVGRVSTRFNFRREPGMPAPPFPKSIYFAPNNILIVTFDRQYIASILLEFEGTSHLHSSFQTAEIDYSGLHLLKAITSASEEEVQQLTRVWVYGCASETEEGEYPFLFINEGVATLSGSALGAAIIRDTITHRKVQKLEHTAIVGRGISAIAYHVSNDAYNIATADSGVGSTIKIWTSRKSLRPQVHHGFLVGEGWVVVTLVVTFIIAVLVKANSFSGIDKVFRVYTQGALAFARTCIELGYLMLFTTGNAPLGLDAGDSETLG